MMSTPATPTALRHTLALTGPLGLVAIVVIALYAAAAEFHTRAAVAEVKGTAALALSSHASRLSSALNERLALVRGLAAFVTVEAGADGFDREVPEFAEAMRAMFPDARNISVSPDFVVWHVHPRAGNEKVLGNNLLTDPRPGFADAVRRAIDTGDVTIHGPLPLLQGGIGLIARQAVYADGKPWGAVGVVFDVAPLLTAIRPPEPLTGFDLAIRAANGAAVTGDTAVFDGDPVRETLHLPDGYWELAVSPRDGWTAMAMAQNPPGLMAGAFLLIGILAEVIAYLLFERRAQLEWLVAQRTVELDRARRELEQFAYAAAHDLQEPVRALASYAQLLARHLGDGLDADAREFVGYIVQGATRLKSLLRDVQLFLAEDSAPLSATPTAADPVLNGVLSQLAPRVAETGAVIHRRPLPEVRADERHLREILTVLLDNALTYHAPNRPPEIQVDASRRDGFDVITVRDNGIGIEEKYFEQIFAVFRRLHPRDVHSGTGMGLAIARKMVERLGGRITVESSPGLGSAFHIALPAASRR